jgi:hypothetical protein
MRTILSLALVLFAGLLAVNAAPGHGPDPRAAEVLARAKQAAGGAAWDSVRLVRMKMQIETSGLKGPAESLEDVRTGTYVDTFKLGNFAGASGYDGKTVWEQDSSGQVAIMSAADQVEGAVNEAYRRAHAFWYANRAKAAIDYAGAPARSGTPTARRRASPTPAKWRTPAANSTLSNSCLKAAARSTSGSTRRRS